MVNIVKLYNVDIGINDEKPVVCSQTLFSAILNALPDKAESLLKNPHFTVSSMFPFFVVNGHETTFFPIVSSRFLWAGRSKPNDKIEKDLKKAYLVKVEALMNGIKEEDLRSGNSIFFNSKDFYFKQSHNSISRKTADAEDTKPFFSFRIKTSQSGGLWFAYPKAFEKDIKGALQEIQEFGFGRDKSTSARPFESFEFEEIKDSGNCFINLGLYSPTKAEMDFFLDEWRAKSGVFYPPKFLLKSYSGWTEYHEDSRIVVMEKPAKYYFAEGSIFPSQKKEVYGQRGTYKELVYDFKHKIFWNGVTLPFYFNWGKMNE